MANIFTVPACAVHGLPQPCDDCARHNHARQNHVGRLPHDERPFLQSRRDAVIAAVIREREFQDKKYGMVLKHDYRGPDTPPDSVANAVQGRGGHELGAWLIVIEKELDEAKDALVHGGSKQVKGRNTIRAELVQLAAVAFAALEQHGVEE